MNHHEAINEYHEVFRKKEQHRMLFRKELLRNVLTY